VSLPDPKPTKRVRDPQAVKRFRLMHLGEPCMGCAMRQGIHVHHRTFRSQGGGDVPENLVWLCGVCHDEEHGIRSVWY
jgi:5-methylcytosine-specific restriction endonuclease McrA